MSDLGSDLKGAVLSPNAKTLKAACYAGKHPLQMWEAAKRWFGELKICDPGDEDIFFFEHLHDEVLPWFLQFNALQAIARGSHIFQFDPIGEHFVRRDKVWFQHPARIQAETIWVYTKDNLTKAESEVIFES